MNNLEIPHGCIPREKGYSSFISECCESVAFEGTDRCSHCMDNAVFYCENCHASNDRSMTLSQHLKEHMEAKYVPKD